VDQDDVCSRCGHEWKWHTLELARRVYGKYLIDDGRACHFDHPAIKIGCGCGGFALADTRPAFDVAQKVRIAAGHAGSRGARRAFVQERWLDEAGRWRYRVYPDGTHEPVVLAERDLRGEPERSTNGS
jgi:hypothetical protein